MSSTARQKPPGFLVPGMDGKPIRMSHPNEFYTENCEYTIVNNEKLEEQIKNVIEKIMLNF